MEIEKSDSLFAAQDSSTALAYLTWAARHDPSNEVAAARLFSAQTQRVMNPPVSSRTALLLHGGGVHCTNAVLGG